MLSSKIILRRPREMDRHRFYQNIRNGAREAKRTGGGQRSNRPPAGGTTAPSTEDTDRPPTLPNSGRKTTRFDTGNDDDDLENNPRYDDSYETTKLSAADIRTPRQPSPAQEEQSFHRTIYSPRTDRRGTSRVGPRSPARSPARSVAGVGSRMNNREDTSKSGRRDRSGERSAVEMKRGGDDDVPQELPVKESTTTTTNQLMAENKLLKTEMEDVNNQLEMLKREGAANIQRIDDARRDMDEAERQHRNEIDTLKDRMRDVEASKAELVNEVETQMKKKELFRAESERLRSELERARGVAENEQRTATLREKLEKEKERLEEELEKQTDLVDKLTADNAILKEHCLAAEKDRGFEEELNRVKGKLENKKKKLEAARKGVDELKKKALSPEQEAELRDKIEKLASALKAKDLLLEGVKKERRDALREKTELEAKCKDLKDQFIDLRSQLNSAQKANEQLHDDGNQMERDLTRVKTENKNLKEQIKEEKENALKLLRFAALEEKIGPLKESIREKDAKIAGLEEKFGPLVENIRAKDVKIVDLQTEIETLRGAVDGYQRQMDAMRHDPKQINTRLPTYEVSNPVIPDHANAHRRLLDENSRLLTLLDHYRHLASQPPPIVDDGPHFPVVPSRAPAQRTNGDLVEAKRQLRSSEDRVAQLEKWLDEIYNNKNFQVVTKSQGRITLPDLPKRLVMIKGSSDQDKKIKTGFMTDRAQ